MRNITGTLLENIWYTIVCTLIVIVVILKIFVPIPTDWEQCELTSDFRLTFSEPWGEVIQKGGKDVVVTHPPSILNEQKYFCGNDIKWKFNYEKQAVPTTSQPQLQPTNPFEPSRPDFEAPRP